MPNTELIATNKIEGLLAFSDHLRPSINTEDKLPSFDGDVYIQPHGKKKDDLRIVRVQVKGHEAKSREELERETVSYQAEIVDLENYNRNGGVLFFMVCYFERETRAYYCSLLPVKLRRLLNEAGDQSSKSITLLPVPDNTSELEELFINHHENLSRQMSFNGAEFPEADFSALPANSRYALRYTSIAQNEREALSHMIGKENYLYLESPGYPIPIPTKHELMVLGIEEQRPITISVNGTEYYDQVSLPISANQQCAGDRVVKIGCLTCTFPPEGNNGAASLSFAPKGTFREKLHALRFMKALIEHSGIEINGTLWQIRLNDALNEFSSSGMQDKLEFLEDLESVLSAFGDDADFEIPDITERELRDIDILKRGLVNGEKLPLVDVGYTYSVCRVSFFGRSYLVFRHTGEDGLSEIHDYVSSAGETVIADETTGIPLKITKYGSVNPNDLMRVSNLSAHAIACSCIEAGENIANRQISNAIALALLDRFDKMGNLEDLEASEEIFLWLSKTTSDGDSLIHRINLYQIRWRKNSLDHHDFTVIRETIENEQKLPKKDRLFTAACLALQGKQKEANTAFRALNQANRKSIEGHPIERVLTGKARKVTPSSGT